MQTFFEKPSRGKKPMRAESRALTLQTNRFINNQIDKEIEKNRGDIVSRLHKEGFDEQQVEKFFQRLKHNMQLKSFEVFKEILRQEVLSNRETGSIESTGL